MYVVLLVWYNGHKSVAMLVEDDAGNSRQFESLDEIRESLNLNFPAEYIAININTLETTRLS